MGQNWVRNVYIDLAKLLLIGQRDRMGRQTSVIESEDGSATLRVTVGQHTWRLVKRHAERLGVTPMQGAHILMLYVEALLQDDQIAWLGLDWQQSAKAAQDQAGGLPPSLRSIDLSKLHRSDKVKSGFVGVYANGKGFRATGRRGVNLGTFKTAEEAAARRFLHYKQQGLPYGEMEIAIDELRRQGERGTDEQLREIVLETARLTGTEHYYDEATEPRGELKMLGFEGGPEEAMKKLRELDEG